MWSMRVTWDDGGSFPTPIVEVSEKGSERSEKGVRGALSPPVVKAAYEELPFSSPFLWRLGR